MNYTKITQSEIINNNNNIINTTAEKEIYVIPGVSNEKQTIEK